jgi:hypothetical protein
MAVMYSSSWISGGSHGLFEQALLDRQRVAELKR